MKHGDLEEAARCSRKPNVHLGPKELRHHDGKEQKDQQARGENELQRLGQEISRLAKRVVELAAEAVEIERREAQRERQPHPAAAEPGPDSVDRLLRERERIWELEDAARGAENQLQLEREATQAGNALWERVCKLPWKERSEYERRESELERQQGRDRGGMSR